MAYHPLIKNPTLYFLLEYIDGKMNPPHSDLKDLIAFVFIFIPEEFHIVLPIHSSRINGSWGGRV